MKLSLVNPEDFAVQFGTSYIKEGNFEYYSAKEGLGLIKSIDSNSIETVKTPNFEIQELSEKEELAIMNIICGTFSKDAPEIPKFKTLEMHEEELENSKSNRLLHSIIYGGALLLIVVLFLLMTR